jgi:hypothetical protein
MAVGLAAAAWQLAQRVEVERAAKKVAVIVDWDEVERLAAVTGGSVEEVLRQFRDRISHVALSEQTWPELDNQGLIQVWGGPVVPQGYVPAGYVVVNVASWTRAQELAAALQAKGFAVRTPPGAEAVPALVPSGRALLVPAAALASPELGVGYDRQAVERVQRLGLGLVARPRAALVSSAAAVQGSLRLAQQTGAQLVVFLGNEVVGNPEMLTTTAEALRALGLKFGWVELSPQLGADRLAQHLGGELVRTHSVSELEMHVLRPAVVLERYLRAARERGVRALYVRLLPTAPAGESLLTANVNYLSALQKGLQAQGLKLGEPQPLAPLEVAPLTAAGLGVGVAGLVLAAGGAVGLGWAENWAAVAAAVVLGAALPLAHEVARAALALLAVVGGASLVLSGLRPPKHPAARPLGSSVVVLLKACLVSFLGATLAAALLSDRVHMSGAELFRGVKLSLLLPPLVVLLVQVARATPTYAQWAIEGGERGEGAALRAGLREAANYAVRYWHVALGLLVLALAVLMAVRSGNEPLFGLSGVELSTRSALERVLGVRPRTKEFGFGHPLLMLGLWLLYRGRRRGLWLLLAAGEVGQASLANTFCHLHTPYLLSLQRAAAGLLAGLLVGLVLIGMWRLGERWCRAAPTAARGELGA